jgi:hypothetical protein
MRCHLGKLRARYDSDRQRCEYEFAPKLTRQGIHLFKFSGHRVSKDITNPRESGAMDLGCVAGAV